MGRLVEEKGGADLLDALAEVGGLWRLDIIGDGPEKAALQTQARRLGMAEQVTFATLPSTRMPGYYQGLDVLVVPSRTRPNWKEQFGRVIVEAMACGCPSWIVQRAIPDVIGNAGVIVPEGDRAALAGALRGLMGDPDRRRAGRTGPGARAGPLYPGPGRRPNRRCVPIHAEEAGLMLKAVLFDLDQTLITWDDAEPWETYQGRRLRGVYDFVDTHLYPLTAGDADSFLPNSRGGWARRGPKATGRCARPASRPSWRPSSRSFGAPPGQVDMGAVMKAYNWQPAPGEAAFPDVLEVLPELHAHGVELGIVTNASLTMRYRDRELDAVGLLDLFRAAASLRWMWAISSRTGASSSARWTSWAQPRRKRSSWATTWKPTFAARKTPG
ncbi:MAG: glycosyltransferase [Anaerolineae bacterium]|nr:glycosyltransferase [Anaerolineae bacterium]